MVKATGSRAVQEIEFTAEFIYAHWLKILINQFKCVIRKKKKRKAYLFNEIFGVDTAQRVSLYLVVSMLMIVEDHLFPQYQVYCKQLRNTTKS